MEGKMSVYCQTCPEYCRPDDVYLGTAANGEKLKCPICGRWTVSDRKEEKRRNLSDSKRFYLSG